MTEKNANLLEYRFYKKLFVLVLKSTYIIKHMSDTAEYSESLQVQRRFWGGIERMCFSLENHTCLSLQYASFQENYKSDDPTTASKEHPGKRCSSLESSIAVNAIWRSEKIVRVQGWGRGHILPTVSVSTIFSIFETF